MRSSCRLRRIARLALIAGLSACAAGTPGRVSPERVSAREAARQAIAGERSLDATTLSERSVGVPPFAVLGRDTTLAALAYGLADLLTTDLARSGRLQVVDRLRLDAVLQEIRLVGTGRVDTATAPRVGRLVQARRLILGDLDQTGDGRLMLGASVADVATGETREAVAATARLDDILRAEKELAFQLFTRLGVALTPAERGAVEQLPTRNIAALLAYSRGVRFEAEGRYAEAAREYGQAVRLDPGFQAATEHLESVQHAGPPALPPTQQASAGTDRAANVVTDRINDLPLSPIGGQLIAPPGEGGADLELPTTVTITVTVPE